MGLPSHQDRQAKLNRAGVYARHRPETTLLYQIIQEYWPEFQAELASHGRYLPAYVTKEFDEYLKCGRLEYGFLRVRCESCHDEKLVAFSCKKRGFCPSCGAARMADSAALLVDEVLPHQPMRQWVLSVPFPLRFLFASNPKAMTRALAIVYRAIATLLVRKAGYTKTTSQTGAVTLIQRFGGALNLNIHFHMLFLDGVYIEDNYGASRFRRVKAPTSDELSNLTHTIAHRVGRCLERRGLLERDADNTYLTQQAVINSDEDPSSHLLGSSITYRIAVGPQQGRKVMTLQTIPNCGDDPFTTRVANVAGFSLHAGVATKTNERTKLERLCRYITRPAVSTKRLSMTRNGRVRYELKTPWRNGTTHVIFEPLDFISRLVSLVPRPRVNLTRFHGVFAPNSKYRARVTPAKRGKGKTAKTPKGAPDQTPAEKRASITWAKRLKRVFYIDIETCGECGGDARIIASIEDPVVIQKILTHLDDNAAFAATAILPDCRASPSPKTGLFN